MERIVTCMKWGDLYGPDYANVLYRAVRHHLPGPYRFICFTDDTSGLIGEIETQPIPDLPISAARWRKGGWPKIVVFKEGLLPKGARILFLDIDSFIWGDLARFFTYGSGVVMQHDWKRFADYMWPWRPQKMMSAIFAFTVGEEYAVYDKFATDPEQAYRDFRIEQYYISERASSCSPWPEGWAISFKRSLVTPSPFLISGENIKKPPASASVVCFHGEPRMREICVPQDKIWGDKMRRGTGPTSWGRAYWQKFSQGRDKALDSEEPMLG